MKDALNTMYIGTKIRIARRIDDFKENESGVSSIVATVLLILVVVLLAAAFWEHISEWFEETWDTIMGEASKIKE